MRRLLFAICLSLIATAFPVSRAAACKWDRDTVRTEREFQRNYEFKSGQESDGSTVSDGNQLTWSGVALSFSGLGLMVARVMGLRWGGLEVSQREMALMALSAAVAASLIHGSGSALMAATAARVLSLAVTFK